MELDIQQCNANRGPSSFFAGCVCTAAYEAGNVPKTREGASKTRSNRRIVLHGPYTAERPNQASGPYCDSFRMEQDCGGNGGVESQLGSSWKLRANSNGVDAIRRT